MEAPGALTPASDRAARRLDRSRSWVIADAIRHYTARPGTQGLVREPRPEYPDGYLRGLGPSRTAQLESDLRLTPTERVRAAEEMTRVGRIARRVGEEKEGGKKRESTPNRRFQRTAVAEVCGRLNEEGARYVVVGAVAMQLWGTSRSTKDIDLLIEPTVANGELVLRALAKTRFGFAREWDAREVTSRPMTVLGDSPRVDLLTVAWSVRYAGAIRRAEVFEVEGVKIPAASIEDLIASKQTGRLQDAADIEVLEEIRGCEVCVPGPKTLPARGRPSWPGRSGRAPPPSPPRCSNPGARRRPVPDSRSSEERSSRRPATGPAGRPP